MSTDVLDPVLYSTSGIDYSVQEPTELDAWSYSHGRQSVTIESDIPEDFMQAMAEYQAGKLLDFDQVIEEESGPDPV